MNDLVTKTGLERLGNVDCDFPDVFPFEHSGNADSLNYFGQTFAFDIFHGEPAEGTTLPGSINLDDVRRLDRQHRFHRPHESFARLIVGSE